MKINTFLPVLVFYTLVEKVRYIFKRDFYLKNPKIPNLELKKIIKTEGEFPHKTVGIYKFKNELVLGKTLNHVFPNIYSFQMESEFNLLNLISNTAKKIKGNVSVIVPKFLIKGEFYTFTSQSLVDGRPLRESSKDKILLGFDFAQRFLSEISNNLSSSAKAQIPVRTPLDTFITFPFYLLLCIFKEPSQIKHLLTLFWKFYFYFDLKRLFGFDNYVLAHRDLTPDNILVNKNKYVILDLEVSRACEPETDLALFPRFYLNYLTYDEIKNYLKNRIHSFYEYRNFARLSIYYCIQLMWIERKDSVYYKEIEKYIKLFLEKLDHDFSFNRPSAAEKLYFFALDVISPAKLSLKNGKNIILCYHAIDNSGWRFSTRPEDFKKQLALLSKKFKIVPLPELLADNSKGKNLAAITFDDGYASVIENALPIMKSFNVKGSVFVIGNPDKRDKKILDNNFPLMTSAQLKTLIKNGWTLGYHTKTHTDFRNISKKSLLKELKSNYKYFAYPNGYYDQNIVSLLKELGYIGAFTINAGFTDIKNKYLISRIPMEGKISLNQFQSLINPAGIMFSRLFMSLLRFKAYGI